MSLFSGAPRGLGLATATTSAAFFPHLEQRVRRASSLSVIFQPTGACQGLRLDLAACAAVTDYAHQELTKAIVELLDVSEHPHGRMVLTGGAGVHAVRGVCGYCMERR